MLPDGWLRLSLSHEICTCFVAFCYGTGNSSLPVGFTCIPQDYFIGTRTTITLVPVKFFWRVWVNILYESTSYHDDGTAKEHMATRHPESYFNIKIVFLCMVFQYRDKILYKKAVRLSYRYNGNLYTGKSTSLYRDGPWFQVCSTWSYLGTKMLNFKLVRIPLWIWSPVHQKFYHCDSNSMDIYRNEIVFKWSVDQICWLASPN